MAQIPPLESESPEYLNALHPAMKKWRERRGVDDITPEQNRRGLAAYYGLTTELDRYIGQIMDTVQSSSDANNTVIIYTSDHGDMAHEHGMWWKSSFYEGSVGIPLICSWPGHLHENHTEDAIVSLIDVGAPTALGHCGRRPHARCLGAKVSPHSSQAIRHPIGPMKSLQNTSACSATSPRA